MDDDASRPRPAHHMIGESLDRLSLLDFDERIAALQAEVARLEAARERKRRHLDEAGAVFGRPR